MHAAMTAPASGGAIAETVAGARRRWTAAFRAAGIESPELDARLLVGHALGLDHAALAASASRVLDTGAQDAIAALAGRRLAHEPVARIVGSKEFWSLDLHVDAATLVPRPETETVVEAALDAIDARWGRAAALRIADLGTGSGAILLALLSELGNACGIGTDANPRALAVARDNARRLGPFRTGFVACDLAAALGRPFEMIVSNPPYIPTADIPGLAPEVRLFDPHLALDGGADGLACYRGIVTGAADLLVPGGVMVLEFGTGQAAAIAALLSAGGLVPSPPRYDLTGRPRALVAERPA